MLLLSPDQVEFCQVSRHDLSGSCLLDGIAYRDKLFHHIEAYPVEAQDSALRKARQRYNAVNGEKALIVLNEPQRWTVWEEDVSLSIHRKAIATPDGDTKSIDHLNLEILVEQMRSPHGLRIQDRLVWHRRHRRVFVGKDAVDWMTKGFNISAEEGTRLGQRLIETRKIYPLPPIQGFHNDASLYRFYADET
jgi:hypothetical protein